MVREENGRKAKHMKQEANRVSPASPDKFALAELRGRLFRRCNVSVATRLRPL